MTTCNTLFFLLSFALQNCSQIYFDFYICQYIQITTNQASEQKKTTTKDLYHVKSIHISGINDHAVRITNQNNLSISRFLLLYSFVSIRVFFVTLPFFWPSSPQQLLAQLYLILFTSLIDDAKVEHFQTTFFCFNRHFSFTRFHINF